MFLPGAWDPSGLGLLRAACGYCLSGCDAPPCSCRVVHFVHLPVPLVQCFWGIQALVVPAPAQEYIRVFEPLLLEECAAQLVRGQEEEGSATAHAAVVASVSPTPHVCAVGCVTCMNHSGWVAEPPHAAIGALFQGQSQADLALLGTCLGQGQ